MRTPLASVVNNEGKVEATFRNLLEAAPDAMIAVSGEGNMIFVNARTEILFGYDRHEILGQKIEMLVPERFRNSHMGYRKHFSVENRARPMGTGIQLYGLRKDGSEFPVEISLSPLQTDESFLVLSAIRDVTARREMEAQLEASRMKIAASARLSALGVMAGGIAHEINNPLGIIHAYANNLVEMAQSGNVSLPSLATASSRIVETSERISGIVKSLRHIARDGSKDTYQFASVREMIEQALELCGEKFRMHSIRLITPDLDPHLRIRCRQVQVTQVILNLLQNAYDAVVETEGERWIRIAVHTTDQRLAISFMDSGPGVPQNLRQRIMEPFFTTKPVGKGTGLGLSISKSIAEDHGGELKLEDREGHTCFSLILPAEK